MDFSFFRDPTHAEADVSCLAIEYESSQKSKTRYQDIFFHDELDEQINQVLYVVSNPKLIPKLSKIAAPCRKVRFVALEDLKGAKDNSVLKQLELL